MSTNDEAAAARRPTHTDRSMGAPVTAEVEVSLRGATQGARKEFSKAVQAHADLWLPKVKNKNCR
jgi:hypothetical protein